MLFRSLCVRQMGYMDEKVPEMSCCDICMGHIDKKIIKKSFCKSQTGHVDEKMLQMSCYDICMGHNKNFFSHMSQLTGKAGHNIQIFLHMSRFFIECIFIKYEKYYGQKTSMNSKYL